MAERSFQTPFEQLLAPLVERGVEFIVIGGQAETIFGSARVTFDTDICYRRTRENLVRLAAALETLKPTLRGAPPDLPFRIDAASLALGGSFTFDTVAGPFDLLAEVEPLGDYERLLAGAVSVRIGNLDVKVIGLDDLIAVKRHLGRAKDQESLRQLLAVKKLCEG